ncbi:MAG: DUF1572 family protein [Saprospiraceae bacterium]|nr:DUF1572 family protein [Saprospiraceae bacterium]MDZ4706444.1 DUF1572 family protein [Saprospiraceae bacterium]
MFTDTLKTLFRRDLLRLKQEMELYREEQNLWISDKGIANSAGNPCLHLTGNLRAYIGAQLSQSGYLRNRDAEFSLKNVPRAELIAGIDETIAVVENTLDRLTDSQLQEEYPQQVFGHAMTTGYFLIHLATHLGYHLGQVNYHRRLLEG